MTSYHVTLEKQLVGCHKRITLIRYILRNSPGNNNSADIQTPDDKMEGA